MPKFSKIHIERCQIKSLKKAKRLCILLDEIEKEYGIKEVEICFEDNFVCPDIDLTLLSGSKNPMEKLIGGLLIKCDILKYGEKSKYKKVC